MITANSTMNSDAPLRVIPFAWRNYAVEGVFGAVLHAACAVDDPGFFWRYAIAITQRILALFNDAYRVVFHGTDLSALEN